jgi:ketosteroid isomerase-like protein
MHKTGGMTFSRFETSELQPRIMGDIAVVTGRLQRTRTGGGRTTIDDWRFRKVYRRDASGWRVISYHAWEPPR